MMEHKLWFAFCALLLVNLGSADHGEGHAAASSPSESAPVGEAPPEAPPADSEPGSSPDPISHAATAPSPNSEDINSTSPVVNNTTAEEEAMTLTAKPDTENVPASATAAPEDRNSTNETMPQPPTSFESPAPTSVPSLTTRVPTHITHSDPGDTTPTSVQPVNTSHASAPAPSIQTTQTKTHSATSVPTPEPPKPEKNTTTTVAQSTSTSTTSSAQESPNPGSPALTSPQSTAQPGRHPETSTEPQRKSSSTSQPSSSTAQAKAHDTPSQLNVAGDTTMVHEAPTLDPLLAGLVSAFIITAVIITLLLFLKLRRRDNRPEFRRLQDLPMDDMMEDTPLSMYSY